jgi:hypothetical protein
MTVLPVVEGFSKNWSAVWHFAAIVGNVTNIFALVELAAVDCFAANCLLTRPITHSTSSLDPRFFTPDLWTNIWCAPPVACRKIFHRGLKPVVS